MGFGLKIPEKRDNKAVVKRNNDLFAGDAIGTLKASDKPKILATSTKNLTEQIQETALQEDPDVFEYDEVYDKVSSDAQHKAKLESRQVVGGEGRPSQYMSTFLKSAEERRTERQLAMLRKNKEEAQSAEEPVFITLAYRKKLEDMKAKEEAIKRERLDEGNVTGRRLDMNRFYGNIMRRDPLRLREEGEGHDKKDRERSPPSRG